MSDDRYEIHSHSVEFYTEEDAKEVTAEYKNRENLLKFRGRERETYFQKVAGIPTLPVMKRVNNYVVPYRILFNTTTNKDVAEVAEEVLDP